MECPLPGHLWLTIVLVQYPGIVRPHQIVRFSFPPTPSQNPTQSCFVLVGKEQKHFSQRCQDNM